MRIAVIDGMGGGIGAQIVTQLKQEIKGRLELIALGTNAAAADRMIRAGADRGASGENAIRVSAGTADIIVGPIGIVIPDSMMGELTSVMAQAIFASKAEKLLIPIVQQHFTIVGYESKPIGSLIAQTVQVIKSRLGEND
ncbi:MAG: DUF3842 family protein [Spirochaetales bacterium]|jgi:hypothetical protein|nr:DUF3842 family protein [Spirochaetales bacterium]